MKIDLCPLPISQPLWRDTTKFNWTCEVFSIITDKWQSFQVDKNATDSSLHLFCSDVTLISDIYPSIKDQSLFLKTFVFKAKNAGGRTRDKVFDDYSIQVMQVFRWNISLETYASRRIAWCFFAIFCNCNSILASLLYDGRLVKANFQISSLFVLEHS